MRGAGEGAGEGVMGLAASSSHPLLHWQTKGCFRSQVLLKVVAGKKTLMFGFSSKQGMAILNFRLMLVYQANYFTEYNIDVWWI